MAAVDPKLTSRNQMHEKDVTRDGHDGEDIQGGDPTQGEGFGPGSRYAATLRERENLSLNRNAGPERPSANAGKIPSVDMDQRKTGKVG